MQKLDFLTKYKVRYKVLASDLYAQTELLCNFEELDDGIWNHCNWCYIVQNFRDETGYIYMICIWSTYYMICIWSTLTPRIEWPRRQPPRPGAARTRTVDASCSVHSSSLCNDLTPLLEACYSWPVDRLEGTGQLRRFYNYLEKKLGLRRGIERLLKALNLSADEILNKCQMHTVLTSTLCFVKKRLAFSDAVCRLYTGQWKWILYNIKIIFYWQPTPASSQQLYKLICCFINNLHLD